MDAGDVLLTLGTAPDRPSAAQLAMPVGVQQPAPAVNHGEQERYDDECTHRITPAYGRWRNGGLHAVMVAGLHADTGGTEV